MLGGPSGGWVAPTGSRGWCHLVLRPRGGVRWSACLVINTVRSRVAGDQHGPQSGGR